MASVEFEAVQFIAERFSHALRTPLGVVLGIMEGVANGEALKAEDHGDGLRSVRKLIALSDHLRVLSRLQSGRAESACLAQICSHLEHAFPTLKIEGRRGDGFSVPGDEQTICSALSLIVKYAESVSMDRRQLPTLRVDTGGMAGTPLTVDVDGGHRALQATTIAISVPVNDDARVLFREPTTSLEVAKNDARPDSCFLFMAARILERVHAQCTVTLENDLVCFTISLDDQEA